MRTSFIAFLFFASLSFFANKDYRYFIDLKNVSNDKIAVKLFPPALENDQIDYCFPAMVPGTYEVYNFGRYISQFKVTDKNGNNLPFIKTDLNTYRISKANEIAEITYLVDDSWDKMHDKDTSKIVFEPAGTNIEEGKNFTINTQGFFGYFKGITNKHFILEFNKPKNFYPSTGLSDIVIGDQRDQISIFDYHDLIDSPILYNIPDTTTIHVANTKVLVSCYSPNKKINSAFIARTLETLLYVQRDYLGGELPVNKYAFLFYFTDGMTRSGSNGALEHSYSSLYVLPEMDTSQIQQEIRDVAAHEFFHIVTPLNIHSKEIGDFDFNKPQMSEHLWLYEGMTEYAAHHAQAKGGLIGIDDLLNIMMQKYVTSITEFNDTMSFTRMSKHVLDENIHKQYSNVYEKGALIGMCLDVLLRDLSDGKYGTQELMKDLAGKYGKNKSFNDADLFNDIEKFTYVEIGAFLRKHVSGKTPLPIKDILNRIGIDYQAKSETRQYTFGGPELSYNAATDRLMITGTDELDAFGKALGFKIGDELNKINGKEVRLSNAKEVIGEYYNTVKENDKITIEVYRKTKSGSYKTKTLKAKARKVKVIEEHKMSLSDNMTEKQKQTLRAWIGL
jgi:predicted metalloprotease with PDZ domain